MACFIALNIVEAASGGRLISLVVILISLVLLLFLSVACRLKGSKKPFFIIFPFFVAVSIFIYGDIIHFGGTAAYHSSIAASGHKDVIMTNSQHADFYTCLVAFRLLTLFAILIALLGACIHLPVARGVVK